MWICLPDGFFSIVNNSDNSDQWMVRCRDLKQIKRYFPSKEIHEWENRDYQYRVILSKEEMVSWVTKQAENITYTNFKDAVRDRRLNCFFEDIWYLGVKYFDHRHYFASKKKV